MTQRVGLQIMSYTDISVKVFPLLLESAVGEDSELGVDLSSAPPQPVGTKPSFAIRMRMERRVTAASEEASILPPPGFEPLESKDENKVADSDASQPLKELHPSPQDVQIQPIVNDPKAVARLLQELESRVRLWVSVCMICHHSVSSYSSLPKLMLISYLAVIRAVAQA